MKKFLLFVSAMLFTLGGTAQTVSISKLMNENFKAPTKTFKLKSLKRIAGENLQTAKVATRAGENAPEGTPTDYFVMKMSYRLGPTDALGYYFILSEKATFYTAADGKTVYIPAMFYTSLLSDSYLTGTLSDDGTTITIPSQQLVGQLAGDDVYISKLDENTGAPSSDPIVMTIDKQSGVIDNFDMVGLADSNGGLYTYCTALEYIPQAYSNSPVTRKMTCDGEEYSYADGMMMNKSVETDVQDYYVPDLDTHFMFGLINYYPQSCVTLMGDGTGSGKYYLQSQAIYDDYGDCIFTSNAPFDYQTLPVYNSMSTFTYDSAADTFTQAEGEYLIDLYGYSPDGMNLYIDSDFSYTNMKIGPAPVTGISSLKAADGQKNVVATEYYDVSGRRVNSAEKGITIKVEKFADGTSKAVKVMK